MSCLPKIPSLLCLFVVLLNFQFCQHSRPESSNSSDDQEILPQELKDYPKTLSELEALEIENPLDPRLKLLLGIHYYCQKQRALAFENWAWINRFAPEEKMQEEARKYLYSSKLDESLDCQNPQFSSF